MAVVERSRLTPDRPECPAINAYIADMIPRLRPATVILSAAWAWYPDRSPLDATVALVRHAGVQRVVLVGPVPNWTESLPQVLVAAFERDPLHRIPQRTSAKLVRDTVDVDRELRATAGRLGVAYVSPLEILCDRNGCLTRASDRTDDLMAWDGSHLTSDGSALLMTAAAGTIFGERPPGIPGVN
jgi:hypothetical protein